MKYNIVQIYVEIIIRYPFNAISCCLVNEFKDICTEIH